jgi:predicted HNH restriction endonuclease
MNQWSEDDLKLVLNLYYQLPFGKLDKRTPQVQELAKQIERSSNAVAMKLVNFASLDPDITDTGRKGLANASKTDKKIWDSYNNARQTLAEECLFIRKPVDVLPNLFGEETSYSEGAKTHVSTERAYRDPAIVKGAKEKWGLNCWVCGLDFGKKYGEEYGQGYIEIHHLDKISSGERQSTIDDVRPVCSNCHRILHRNWFKLEGLDGIEKLKQKLTELILGTPSQESSKE